MSIFKFLSELGKLLFGHQIWGIRYAQCHSVSLSSRPLTGQSLKRYTFLKLWIHFDISIFIFPKDNNNNKKNWICSCAFHAVLFLCSTLCWPSEDVSICNLIFVSSRLSNTFGSRKDFSECFFQAGVFCCSLPHFTARVGLDTK